MNAILTEKRYAEIETHRAVAPYRGQPWVTTALNLRTNTRESLWARTKGAAKTNEQLLARIPR